jgi:PAS domain
MLSAAHRQPDSGSGRTTRDAAAADEIEKLIAVRPETTRKLSTSSEPRWSRFFDAWKAMAQEKGGLPSRRDVDPTRIGPDLLPNIFLTDVVRGGKPSLRFRFRLLGQAILERETTRPGAFLDELGASAGIERQYRACLERKVYLREESLVWNDVRKDSFLYSVLILPLADDGETVSHLLGLALYSF